MKIGIHHREGSFSDRWIVFCESNSIPYKLLNCYSSTIIEELKRNEITHLMWHISHVSSTDETVCSYVFNSADRLGIKTFPNFNTRWHFDDKVAQKYLLEAMDAPYIESQAFYSKSDAFQFLEVTSYPVVAKLKGGAGSSNVRLLKTRQEAQAYIEKLFTVGIQSINKPLDNLGQKMRVAKNIKNPIYLAKKTIGFIKKIRKERAMSNADKGYVYFQKFLPNNDHDTRIIVIGDKAFGIRRLVKKDDFRASGSGMIDYDTKKIDIKMVKIAFDVSKKMGAQCLAYDFVYDEKKEPYIVEVCFGFAMKAYDQCEGYWDERLNFIEGPFNPQELMVMDFIK